MPGVLIAALVILFLLRSQERTIQHQRSIMATQTENIATLNKIAADQAKTIEQDAKNIAAIAANGPAEGNSAELDAVVALFESNAGTAKANSDALAALVPPAGDTPLA